MRRDTHSILDELEDMELRLSEALEVNRRLQTKLSGQLHEPGQKRPLMSKEDQEIEWRKIAKVLNAA